MLALLCLMFLMATIFGFVIGGLCVGNGVCISNGNELKPPLNIYMSLIILALGFGVGTWFVARPIHHKVFKGQSENF